METLTSYRYECFKKPGEGLSRVNNQERQPERRDKKDLSCSSEAVCAHKLFPPFVVKL